MVNLLRLQRGDPRGLDLACLALRQAYLVGVEAQDASLAGAHLSEAVLAEAFNFPVCVALSGDGASLVAGTPAGEVWLWRVVDRTPLLAVQGHTSPVYGLALSGDGRLLASGSEDGHAGLELAFLPLVFVPFWFRAGRWLAIAAAAGLHLGILVCMNVGNFPVVMLSLLVLFPPLRTVATALPRALPARLSVEITTALSLLAIGVLRTALPFVPGTGSSLLARVGLT